RSTTRCRPYRSPASSRSRFFVQRELARLDDKRVAPPANPTPISKVEAGGRAILIESLGDSFSRGPLVANPEVIDVDDRTLLNKSLNKLKDRNRRFVEIAIDGHKRCPFTNPAGRCRVEGTIVKAFDGLHPACHLWSRLPNKLKKAVL